MGFKKRIEAKKLAIEDSLDAIDSMKKGIRILQEECDHDWGDTTCYPRYDSTPKDYTCKICGKEE